MAGSRRTSVATLLRQLASNIIPIANVNPDENMMPTTQLNLALSESRVLAGEYLNAKVLVDSADTIVVQSFMVEVKGIGRTGWVNIHTDKIFETERVYLDTRIPILQRGECIEMGKTQYPIQVKIPEECLSSYESQFGTIRYQMKIDLIATTEQASCSEIFPIVVLSRSFFDDIPANIMSPIDFKDEVDFTCCSLPFGCVSVVVSLPRTAYRLGETVEAQVTINNRTRKGLKEVTLQLGMKTQFEARSRYEHVNEKKLSEQLIEMIPLGAVRARCRMEFEKCHIRIPDGAPPTQNYNVGGGETAIIAIHYILKMTAIPGIECEIPLIVTSRGYSDSNKQAAFVLHTRRGKNQNDANQKRHTRNIIEHKSLL